jgi:hypothetical protein
MPVGVKQEETANPLKASLLSWAAVMPGAQDLYQVMEPRRWLTRK